MTIGQIKQLKKEKFAEIVKQQVKKAALAELLAKKDQHSKLSELTYTELKMQNYMKSDKHIHSGKVKSLFQFRTRMVNVKCNFKNMYANLNCPLCDNNNLLLSSTPLTPSLDNQRHLLLCPVIQERCPDIRNNISSKYEDIFGSSTEKMSNIIDLLSKALEIRKNLLEK